MSQQIHMANEGGHLDFTAQVNSHDAAVTVAAKTQDTRKLRSECEKQMSSDLKTPSTSRSLSHAVAKCALTSSASNLMHEEPRATDLRNLDSLDEPSLPMTWNLVDLHTRPTAHKPPFFHIVDKYLLIKPDLNKCSLQANADGLSSIKH